MVIVDSFENAIQLVRIFVDEGYHSSVIINDDDSYTVEFWCDEDEEFLDDGDEEEETNSEASEVNLAIVFADLLDALNDKKCDKK